MDIQKQKGTFIVGIMRFPELPFGDKLMSIPDLMDQPTMQNLLEISYIYIHIYIFKIIHNIIIYIIHRIYTN